MSNISYLRAGISCLPAIGPLVSLANTHQIREELEKAALPIHNQIDTPIEQIVARANRARAQALLILQKGRIYSLAGVIGNLLTVAAVVALFALRVFSLFSTSAVAIVFTSLAGAHAYMFFLHTKRSTALNSTNSLNSPL